MAYLCYELEVGEEGTHHYQGYCRFKKRTALAKVVEAFPRCHAEIARGSEVQNKAYCSKNGEDGGFKEQGSFDANAGVQGRRSDLEAITKECEAGTPIKDIARAHSSDYIRYHAGIEKCHHLLAPLPPALRDVTVVYMWGETNTGKTWRVTQQYGDDVYRVCGHPRNPWDTYKDQRVVCFDEFEDSWPVFEMNQYLDKYRCELACRYSNKWAHWTLVILISNCDLEVQYKFTREPLRAAFLRRIQQTIWIESQEQAVELPALAAVAPVAVPAE